MKILSPPDTIPLLVPNRPGPGVSAELARFGEWVRAWWWIAEMHLQVLSEITRLRLKAAPVAGASLETFARAMVQRRFGRGLQRELDAQGRASGASSRR